MGQCEIMDYEIFQRESAKLENAPVEQKKAFYQKLLKEEPAPSRARLMAYFQLALLYYQEGDFHKVLEILEPLMLNHMSYEYVPELISCFNLMGVASHCEGQYALSRFFYERGMKIAQENDEKSRYAYEYNNISLTYIAEKDYENALKNILLAEQHLTDCDEEMGAYIYLNLAITYGKLGELNESLWALERCIDRYCGREILPDDVLICGTALYYKRREMEKYREYQSGLLERLDEMFASEFMDAGQVLFECALDAKDDELARVIIRKMDDYLVRYPNENNIGLWVEGCKYQYAKMRGSESAMLRALEKKDVYYHRITAASEKMHIREINQYFRVNQMLQTSIRNETHANRVKTDFLANMSHDIRTPINGVIGMLEIIRACRDDEEKVDDCLDKIEASSRLLLSLVNDILDMTKLDSGSVVVEHKPFNLDEVCDEVCKVVVTQAEHEGLTVELEHADVTDVYLLGSAVHLQKILTNLFSNSLKYNKPKGSIHASLREVERTEDTAVYEFKIQDTGIGMTQDFIENRLFKPFVQESNTARSKYGGTGLGMAIVAQLVKKMGGTITVESELGEGTCFTVVLPFDIDKDAVRTAPATKVQKDIRDRRLLVVEDNELNMEIAEFVLKDAGAIVEKAENGAVAVQKYLAAPAGTYDAILMDLMMPVMGGYAATRAIRGSRKPDAGTVPIIAMSANAYEEDVQKCLRCGMNAHLSKPIFKDALIETIARYVKKAEL